MPYSSITTHRQEAICVIAVEDMVIASGSSKYEGSLSNRQIYNHLTNIFPNEL